MSWWPDISICWSACNCWAFQSEHMEACSPSENHKAGHHRFWENHYWFSQKGWAFSLMQTLMQSHAHTESVHQISVSLQNHWRFTKYPNNNHFMSDPISKRSRYFVHYWNMYCIIFLLPPYYNESLIFCYYFQNVHKEFHQERCNDGLILTLKKCLYQCHK